MPWCHFSGSDEEKLQAPQIQVSGFANPPTRNTSIEKNHSKWLQLCIYSILLIKYYILMLSKSKDFTFSFWNKIIFEYWFKFKTRIILTPNILFDQKNSAVFCFEVNEVFQFEISCSHLPFSCYWKESKESCWCSWIAGLIWLGLPLNQRCENYLACSASWYQILICSLGTENYPASVLETCISIGLKGVWL